MVLMLIQSKFPITFNFYRQIINFLGINWHGRPPTPIRCCHQSLRSVQCPPHQSWQVNSSSHSKCREPDRQCSAMPQSFHTCELPEIWCCHSRESSFSCHLRCFQICRQVRSPCQFKVCFSQLTIFWQDRKGGYIHLSASNFSNIPIFGRSLFQSTKILKICPPIFQFHTFIFRYLIA